LTGWSERNLIVYVCIYIEEKQTSLTELNL